MARSEHLSTFMEPAPDAFKNNGPHYLQGQRSVLEEAIVNVVQTFGKYQQIFGQVDVCEALEEFWKMKLTPVVCLTENVSANDGGRGMSGYYENNSFEEDRVSVSYEYAYAWDFVDESVVDDGEDSASLPPVPSEMPVVSYVFLPGGSCFATRRECHSRHEAKLSAAKVALMNSLFNEDPSRKVTTEYARSSLTALESGIPASFGCPISAQHMIGYRAVLDFMEGRSFLEYQEFSNKLRLLKWAGVYLPCSSTDEGIHSRREVLQRWYDTPIDENFRWLLIPEVMEKERKFPGSLNQELDMAEGELRKCRQAGMELRHFYEKRHICVTAMHRVHCERQTAA